MPDGSSLPRKYVFHSLSQCAECGVGGDEFASPNVEAFEVTGELYCDDCASDVLERLADEEDEDPESIIDTSPAAMLRAHGTWRL